MNIKECNNANNLINRLLVRNRPSDVYKLQKPHNIFVNNIFSNWSINYMTKSLYIPFKFKGDFIQIKQQGEFT